jgi:hypothetical protein
MMVSVWIGGTPVTSALSGGRVTPGLAAVAERMDRTNHEENCSEC